MYVKYENVFKANKSEGQNFTSTLVVETDVQRKQMLKFTQ